MTTINTTSSLGSNIIWTVMTTTAAHIEAHSRMETATFLPPEAQFAEVMDMDI